MLLSPITIALVLLVGLSLGLLGSGGAILLIPVLVYVEGIAAQDAVVVSLAVVGIGSVFGAWLHYRNGHYHFRASFLYAVSGSAGAVIGARFTSLVPDTILMLSFGALMVVVGARMQQPRTQGNESGKCRVVPSLLVGAVVGLLTGFLGVGGGFLLIPAMTLIAGLDTHRAVAASLPVIGANSLAGLGGHLMVGAAVPTESLPALVTVMLGIAAGSVAGRRIGADSLRKIFAVLVLLVGIAIVVASMYRLLSYGA